MASITQLPDILVSSSPLGASPQPPVSTYVSTASRCRIKIFHFTDINPDPNQTDPAMDVEVIDLNSETADNPVVSFSYTKSNSTAAGYFQIMLAPTAHWMHKIRPSDWVVVYLSNGTEAQETIRCFGSIDTNEMTDRIDARTGARMLVYSVCGRDFGKVFDKYMIYINIFAQSATAQQATLEQLLIQDVIGTLNGTPDHLIKALVNVFLGGQGASNIALGQQQLNQWLIPQELAAEINKDGGSNFGSGSRFINILNLDHVQSQLDGSKIINTLDVRTPLWTLMQEHANLLINEMFCEMDDDGKPSLYLRVIPFTFSDYSDGGLGATLNKFLELPAVTIGGSHILGGKIGLTDNDAVNFTILLSDALDNDASNPNPSIALVGDEFPFVNIPSAQRHGLQVFEYKTDFALIKGNTGQWDQSVLVGWNRLLKHWYKNNAFFEHGTLTIVGQAGMRLGKRLDIVDGPWLMGDSTLKRSFYIESYMDSWEFGGGWIQTVNLTRGIFVRDNRETFSYDIYADSPIAPIGTTIGRRVG